MRVEQSFVRILSVSFVKHFLVQSHPGWDEQGDSKQGYSHAPPEQDTEAALFGLIHLRAFNIWTGDDCTNNNAHGDHEHREVLGELVPLVEYDNSHNHVGDEWTSSEDHVKWHRNIKIKSVVVADTWHKKHRDQYSVIFQSNLWFDSSELCREDEAMNGDEEELRECDQVSRTWIDSKIKHPRWRKKMQTKL